MSYSAVAGFEPLLRAALRHSSAGNSQHDIVAREATFVALYGVLRSGSNAVEDFVASSEFDLLLQCVPGCHLGYENENTDFTSLDLLQLCVAALDAPARVRLLAGDALTEGRLAHVAARVCENDNDDDVQRSPLIPLTALLTSLVGLVPAFDAQFVSGRCVGQILSQVHSMLHEYGRNELLALQRNIAVVLDTLLSSPTGAPGFAAQQLLSSGAVPCCTALLGAAAVWSSSERGDCDGSGCHDRCAGSGARESTEPSAEPSAGPSADTVARLLRVLRFTLAASASASEPASAQPQEGASAAWRSNASPAAFVDGRGLQTLELLRYAAHTQRAGSPARGDLAQLHALLERLAVAPPAPAESAEAAAQRELAVADVRAFARPFGGDWRRAFDVHIAGALEEGGYPRQVAYCQDTGLWEPLPAPAQSTVAGAAVLTPSAAALSLLQARARESVLAHATGKRFAADAGCDVVMQLSSYNAETQRHDGYRMVIQLDDARFPGGAAYFRTAAVSNALGTYLHRCLVAAPSSAASEPPSADATLPYVALYSGRPEVSCASFSLALPESDIVYGEYTAPAVDAATGAGATLPTGTVLMYPRSVVPPDAPIGSFDIPVFIVFRPCAARLLRGAVPIGRVMSCLPDDTLADVAEAAAQAGCDQPFDAIVLRCFEAAWEASKCLKFANRTSSVVSFLECRLRQGSS
mgnify:CR=1 FL=1